MVGDIACDSDSDFSPIKVYEQATTWDAPVLDVTAIDNLLSLPAESSEDFAQQLLPHLLTLGHLESGVWGQAAGWFERAARA